MNKDDFYPLASVEKPSYFVRHRCDTEPPNIIARTLGPASIHIQNGNIAAFHRQLQTNLATNAITAAGNLQTSKETQIQFESKFQWQAHDRCRSSDYIKIVSRCTAFAASRMFTTAS